MQENPFVQEVVERLHTATKIPAEQIRSTLSVPPSLELGDIAFPCFLLAKERRKSPPEIAGELIDEVFGDPTDHVAGATAAGPYLNVKFDRKAYAEWVLRQTMAAGDRYGRSDEGAGRVVAIDYSSPNIAKPFHVGHLRSTIIGGALYRLFNTLGYRSVGINHLGDWGTQFGKLIVGLKNWGSEEDLQDVLALNRLYVKFHEEEKNDEALMSEAREWFRKQEGEDPEAMRLWKEIRDTSLDYFKRVYVRLGADFDHYTGESFFNDKMDEVVTMATDAGLTEISDSALIINLEKHGIKTPALLKKADGSTLYMTRDLAAVLYRQRAYGFHKLLYVVGSEQALHFQQLFKVCELLGFDGHKDIAHVGFGAVKGMASRAGNVVYLEELLDEAKSRALANMRANTERRPDHEDEEAVAEVIGIAAIFFSDMSNRRIKDYTFDWDRAISFEGDTGPYLLNAHARIAGIIRKCEVEPCSSPDELRFDLLDEPAAHRLVSLVARYPDALRLAARDYEPSTVATYLLDLAKGLHGSYRELRVKGEATELAQARLQLFLAVKQVLANGLGILGIPALERM